jgi:hypothetical protein
MLAITGMLAKICLNNQNRKEKKRHKATVLARWGVNQNIIM